MIINRLNEKSFKNKLLLNIRIVPQMGKREYLGIIVFFIFQISSHKLKLKINTPRYRIIIRQFFFFES